MSTTVNWDKLVAQNRAKAHGIAWSDEEMDAIYNKGIDPEKVRRGILTKEDEEKEIKQHKKEGKPWYHGNTQEIMKLAAEVGIEFDPKSANRSDLMNEIKQVKKKENITEEALQKINQAVNN